MIGGAPVSTAVLDEALRHAPRLIAVDSGADTAIEAGRMPEAVIGDLDSVSAAARSALADRVTHIAEQDSTDFAKALRSFPAGLTIAVGFTGARVDHFLACLTELARSRGRCVLLDEVDCICIAPAHLDLDLSRGTRVSLWPLDTVRGRSRGLHWPIDGIAMSPLTRVGTSNRATGPVSLTLEQGTVALILPARALPILLESLEMASRGGAA
nr:thiamine diphosphokinase [Jannaschia sp. S6380]